MYVEEEEAGQCILGLYLSTPCMRDLLRSTRTCLPLVLVHDPRRDIRVLIPAGATEVILMSTIR
eukprot:1187851-Prorocentrum_minimum.AAC.1